MSDESSIVRFESEMTDRFGPIPEQLRELINIVRLRREAQKIGIERIVLKNNVMLAYFVSNQMSPFYQSSDFTQVLDNLQKFGRRYTLTEQNKKLYIKVSGVNKIEKAVHLLQDILPLHP